MKKKIILTFITICYIVILSLLIHFSILSHNLWPLYFLSLLAYIPLINSELPEEDNVEEINKQEDKASTYIRNKELYIDKFPMYCPYNRYRCTSMCAMFEMGNEEVTLHCCKRTVKIEHSF